MEKTFNVYYAHPNGGFRFVRTVACHTLEDVFYQMQGEVWSPNGEAYDQISRLGVGHTSMSVGDLVLDTDTGIAWQVAMFGFKQFSGCYFFKQFSGCDFFKQFSGCDLKERESKCKNNIS